ncbi:MAG: GNAT family N-acetyltransferase [Halanaerobiales bacterium]|nr:GNAT family N-acetyltransferase [Halanaerobiales bacterium]
MKIKNDNLLISDDKTKLDNDKIHEMLLNSYWASKRSKEEINTSIKHSICFGLYKNNKMIGFARALSDRTVSSWIYDFIIDKDYRHEGLGKWFFKNIIKHKVLINTKIYLTTKDAQGLYKKYGFKEKEALVKNPINNNI